MDGELARLKKMESNFGIFLDATTDRIKETFVYMGIVYYFYINEFVGGIMVAVFALGGSLLVSYAKAKGEMVFAQGKNKLSASEVNRIFQDGLARFEIRMALIALGLLLNIVFLSVFVVAVLAWGTAMYRMVMIGKKL